MTVRSSVSPRPPEQGAEEVASILLDVGPECSEQLVEAVCRLLEDRAGVRVVTTESAELPEPEALLAVDVVVACAQRLPDRRWQDLDDRCAAAGVAWHRVHADATGLSVGPFTVPGASAGYRDLRARRLAASRYPDRLLDHWSRTESAPRRLPDPASVLLAATLIVEDVLVHLDGGRVIGADHEVCVDGETVTRHRVLPLPGRPAGHAPVDGDPEDHLVDARTGVVTALRTSVPGPYPSSLVGVEAEVADTRRFAPWRADPATSGAALGDPGAARRAALGEAVERYCGNAVPPTLPRGSAAELTAAGHRVVPPGSLALYSPEQYATRGFPFVPLHDRLPLDWAQGRDLVTGEAVLVPAAAVYLNGPGTRPGDAPAVSPPALAGIAAGVTTAAAEQAALGEVIERDSVTTWWTTGARATALDVTGDDVIAAALDGGLDGGLDARFLLLPCLVDVPVVAVLLRDTGRGLIGFGTACRSSAVAAARKALTEALVSLEVARELADEGSPFWTGVRAGRVTAAPYRPFRADRAYRDDYRADWRDLTSLEPNVQLYLDPRMQEVVERRTTTVETAVGLDVPGDPREAYLRMLAEHGSRAIGVDVTTDDVARAGLRVSRVVVPGLYQLAPAAFPLLGGTRPGSGHDVVPLPFS